MKPTTYKQAMGELEKILTELESEDVEVDGLSEKVKRAAELIQFCRQTLKKTETEVKAIVKEFAQAKPGDEKSEAGE